MTESTKLLVFKRQKVGYKVTVKNFLVYLCCSILRRTQIPVSKRIWTPLRFERGGGSKSGLPTPDLTSHVQER